MIVADVTDEDIVEERPIVGGAAAQDRGMATSADQSMSSARGAALAAPRPPVPSRGRGRARAAANARDEAARPKRHPVRTVLLLVVLLGVLGGGLWYGWSVTQSRYYVGATDDGTVAIFKGVPGKIAWIELSKVYEPSTLKLDDLTPAAQSTVRQGIQVDSLEQAKDKLAALDRSRQPVAEAGLPDRRPDSDAEPGLDRRGGARPRPSTAPRRRRRPAAMHRRPHRRCRPRPPTADRQLLI